MQEPDYIDTSCVSNADPEVSLVHELLHIQAGQLTEYIGELFGVRTRQKNTGSQCFALELDGKQFSRFRIAHCTALQSSVNR